MTNLSILSKSAIAAIALLGVLGSAQADGFKPGQAKAVDLGDISGVAYYTTDERGFHVVVTLSPVNAQQPVRFESTLADNQSVSFSSPREIGVGARTVALTRKGDRIVVTADRVAALGY